MGSHLAVGLNFRDHRVHINTGGHMHTSNPEIQMPLVGRRRGRYSAQSKDQIVAACGAAGVCTAAIALTNGLNAKLVRRWVVESAQCGGAGLVTAIDTLSRDCERPCSTHACTHASCARSWRRRCQLRRQVRQKRCGISKRQQLLSTRGAMRLTLARRKT